MTIRHDARRRIGQGLRHAHDAQAHSAVVPGTIFPAHGCAGAQPEKNRGKR